MRLALALLGVLFIATRSDANDLLRLYRLAVAHDTTLEAAKHQRDAAIEARPQALSQWLPQLSGIGSKARTFGLEDCARRNATSIARCNVDSTSYGLALTQTVWSYEAYSQFKQADAEAASAEATYVSAQQDLLLRVAQAYFAALGARDQQNTLRLEREAYAMQLKQAQDRERTGLGSRSDVEQARSFYDLTAQNLIDSENALDDAQLTLATIVGEPAGRIAPLTQEIPLAAPDPTSVDAWIDATLRDNPEIRAARLTVRAAERGIAVQRGKAMPTLSLAGTGVRESGAFAPAGANATSTVGVYFDWPLYRGGAVSSAVRQSRAFYQQSEASLEAVERASLQQTRSAYRNILAGIESINAARIAKDSAFTAMQTAKHDIEFNVSPMFVLLQYQAQYYLAVNAHDQARYRYLANVLLLKRQAGRLREDDLAQIDSLLEE